MSYALYDSKTGGYARILHDKHGVDLQLPGLPAGSEFSSELVPAHKHVSERILRLKPQREKDAESRVQTEESLVWPLGMRQAEQLLIRGEGNMALRPTSRSPKKGNSSDADFNTLNLNISNNINETIGGSSSSSSSNKLITSSGPYGPAGPSVSKSNLKTFNGHPGGGGTGSNSISNSRRGSNLNGHGNGSKNVSFLSLNNAVTGEDSNCNSNMTTPKHSNSINSSGKGQGLSRGGKASSTLGFSRPGPGSTKHGTSITNPNNCHSSCISLNSPTDNSNTTLAVTVSPTNNTNLRRAESNPAFTVSANNALAPGNASGRLCFSTAVAPRKSYTVDSRVRPIYDELCHASFSSKIQRNVANPPAEYHIPHSATVDLLLTLSLQIPHSATVDLLLSDRATIAQRLASGGSNVMSSQTHNMAKGLDDVKFSAKDVFLAKPFHNKFGTNDEQRRVAREQQGLEKEARLNRMGASRNYTTLL